MAVNVSLDENEEIAKVKEVLPNGRYDLVGLGGSGRNKHLDLSDIPGRLMRHYLNEGDQVMVIMGRQEAHKASPNVVRGSVVDRKDSNDRLDQYAVDIGSKIIRVGARQVMPIDRLESRDRAIEEFLDHSKTLGLFQGNIQQKSSSAQAKTFREASNTAPNGGPLLMNNLSREELQRRAEIEAAKEAEAAAFDDALGILPYEGSLESKAETPVKKIAPQNAPFSSEPDPRDSPEFRFGVGSDKQQQRRQDNNDNDDEDYHHAIILLGSHEERASSVEAHGDRPTAKEHFLHSGYSRPISSGFKEFPQGMGGLESVTVEGFGAINKRPSSTDTAKPTPPSHPRASRTAPGRMRNSSEQARTVGGLGAVPESVEALHDEIIDIQRALDVEAEILRKAMALLESRKHGNMLRHLNMSELHSFSKQVTGAPEPTHFPARTAESTFPYTSLGTAGFGSGVLSPIKTTSILGNYPAPVSARPGFTPYHQASSVAVTTLRSPDRSRAGSPTEDQRPPDSPTQALPQSRMTHMQISGICVVAKQKESVTCAISSRRPSVSQM